MKYKVDEVPIRGKACSHQNDRVNNMVICYCLGQIKILNCDPDVLEEVLLHVTGSNTFGEIEEKFIGRYSLDEVRNFLETILFEGIIDKLQSDYKETKTPNILVIGDGLIAEAFKDCERITASRFLGGESCYEFDLAIFAPSICTYADALSVNERLYQLKKPYAQYRFDGVKIALGPLVVPNKSACLECIVSHELKRINAKMSKKIEVSDLKSLTYAFKVPEEVWGLKLAHLAEVLCRDVTNFFNGLPSELLDSQYFYDCDLLSHDKEVRLPTTNCGFCKAINTSYVEFESELLLKDIDLNLSELTRADIRYQVGGIRSKTERDTRELLDAELCKLGAKIRIEPAFGNPFNDNNIIPCFNGFIEQTSWRELPHIFRKDESSGKGLTQSQAYFSAAFELFEHVGIQYTGNVPIICAKYNDVKSIAIDMPYLASTIMNKNTAFEDFEETTDIDWVVATSLTGAGKKLVPAFLVFLNDVDLKGALFSPTSNGAAAAVTLEDAILHGLLEVIERDALLIGQSNPYILPIIDYASVTNTKVKEIVSKIKHMGYDIITRDYTNDLNIPVFRTWIVDRDNYSHYAHTGLGCHISPEIALERSITEAVQTNDRADFAGDIDSSAMTQAVLSESLVNLYNQHHLVNKDILGRTSKVTIIGAPIFEMKSSCEAIKQVAKLVQKKVGGDVYYVELTKPSMGVKVVRTIITGDIQQMNYPILSVSKRMFEFGIRCGYSDKKTTYEELFMGKYQF